MSTTTSTTDDSTATERYPRTLAESQSIEITRPKPIDHNLTGTYVLNDTHNPVPGKAPQHARFPDGSLYQQCRAAWMHADDESKEEIDGKERVVLTRDYTPNWLPTEERHAVTLTSSKWQAGRGTGDDYTAFYKYDLKLWSIDADGDLTSDLLHNLTCKIMPQYDDLVYQDGNSLNIPHGEGTLVRTSTTWSENADQLFTRSQDLIRQALDHSIEFDTIAQNSKSIQRQEAHARFHKDKAPDLKHALQQSADLIPHFTGDIDNLAGNARKGKWEIFRFQSSDWDLIGARDTGNIELGIKIYFTENPNAQQGAFQHPKIEAWIADTKDERVPWDAYNAMQEALCELVVEHMKHASVRRAHLVADDMYKPSERPQISMQYTTARREWLRDHYASLTPAVYHEALREQTALPYDILDYLVRNGTATYDDLEDHTGAARRTIREHVARMEKEIGGSAPGLLQRIRSSCTVITFSNEMHKIAENAIEEARPDDTPEDTEDRADERREAREKRKRQEEENGDEQKTPEMETSEAISNDWRTLADLDAGWQEARRLPQNAVKVNITHHDWRTSPHD